MVRTMPNTPVGVGKGVTLVCGSASGNAADMDWVGDLFGSIGVAETVDEGLVDAATALSGSGPAYVFRVVESMARAGVEMGLEAGVAMRLARETVIGAGALMLESDEDAGALRAAVTSRGGMTAAALGRLEAGGIDGLFAEAMRAARDRGAELAEGV